MLRLGAKKREQFITPNENIYDTTHSGIILGLHITNSGYYHHVTKRKVLATQALNKLYRFQEMSASIKIHLVKALVFPVLDYPPIPIHAMSDAQLSILQKVQNKALRFALNQRYPYTLSTVELHELAKVAPVNVRLHNQAAKIWDKIDDLQIPLFTHLFEKRENIVRYQRSFPSSLSALNNPPIPSYH